MQFSNDVFIRRVRGIRFKLWIYFYQIIIEGIKNSRFI